MSTTATDTLTAIHQILAEMPAFPEGTWQGEKRKLDHTEPGEVAEYITGKLDPKLLENNDIKEAIKEASEQHADMVDDNAIKVYQVMDNFMVEGSDMDWGSVEDMWDYLDANEYLDVDDTTINYNDPVKLRDDTVADLVKAALSEFIEERTTEFAFGVAEGSGKVDWSSGDSQRAGEPLQALLLFCGLPSGLYEDDLIGMGTAMIFNPRARNMIGIDDNEKTTITEAESDGYTEASITFSNGNKIVSESR